MISFSEYSLILESLSSAEETQLLDDLKPRANGKVITKTYTIKNEITLKPREWCWFVSKTGKVFCVHNNNGKLVAFKGWATSNTASLTSEMQAVISVA